MDPKKNFDQIFLPLRRATVCPLGAKHVWSGMAIHSRFWNISVGPFYVGIQDQQIDP